MPQKVYALSQSVIEKMKQSYVGNLQPTPQGALFRAKTANAVITAYKSGKVMFQGSAPEIEAEKWTEGTTQESVKSAKSKTRNTYSPPESLFTSSHIGSDEAGTGDYFGPITVAAVFVKKDQIELLKELGVRDSKNLSDISIRKIAREILHLDMPYSLMVLRNEKYNRLQKRGWSQGKMKAMLHHHAIDNLLQNTDKTQVDGILIDQFCEPEIYKKHIASEQQAPADKTYFMTKAESYSIAVAAGSIIARASFLNEMDKLSAKTGFTLPKGASAKVDQTAARLIKSKGSETLNKCAKIHFANTKKTQKYL